MRTFSWYEDLNERILHADPKNLVDAFPHIEEGERIVGELTLSLKKILVVLQEHISAIEQYTRDLEIRFPNYEDVPKDYIDEFHRLNFEAQTIDRVFWSSVQRALDLHECPLCKLGLRRGYKVVAYSRSKRREADTHHYAHSFTVH